MTARTTPTTTDWRPVVAAAQASRRADCGHQLSRRADALVWLRTERAGSNVEVWSVCSDCQVEGTDYVYRFDHPEHRPRRERVETL